MRQDETRQDILFSPTFLKIQAELEKQYPGALRKITGEKDLRRIPTGVFIIDMRLGGGIPVNRILLLCGHNATYKSTLALKIAANYQKLCGLCFKMKEDCQCGDIEKPHMVVYEDIERAMNEEHAVRLGIDPDHFMLFQPPHGEAACEYAERLAQVDDIGLIIVDSLASIVSINELADDKTRYLDSQARGLRARLINRMLRALVIHCGGKIPRTAILINHLLPQQNSKGDLLPGGEEQEYLSSVVLKLWVAESQKLWINAKGEEMIGGYGVKKSIKDAPRETTIGFNIAKSRVSAKDVSGEFTLCLEEHDGLRFADTEEHGLVFAMAQKKGLLTQEKTDWIWNGEKFSSQKKLHMAWMANPQEYLKLQRELMS